MSTGPDFQFDRPRSVDDSISHLSEYINSLLKANGALRADIFNTRQKLDEVVSENTRLKTENAKADKYIEGWRNHYNEACQEIKQLKEDKAHYNETSDMWAGHNNSMVDEVNRAKELQAGAEAQTARFLARRDAMEKKLNRCIAFIVQISVPHAKVAERLNLLREVCAEDEDKNDAPPETPQQDELVAPRLHLIVKKSPPGRYHYTMELHNCVAPTSYGDDGRYNWPLQRAGFEDNDAVVLVRRADLERLTGPLKDTDGEDWSLVHPTPQPKP